MSADASKTTELIIETASYLGVESGEVPRSEVIEQAKAVGYSRQEVGDMLPDEPSLNVPEREPQTFGATWDVSESGITFNGEKATEPLDEGSEDYYGFQEPIATDVTDIENDLYTDDGTAVDAQEAVGRYIGARNGEQISAEKHGFYNTLRKRALRRYRTLLEGDRVLLREYENPTVTLLTLRQSPEIPNRVGLLNELQTALTPVLKKLRYQLTRSTKGPQLDGSEYEYAYVISGTKKNRATSHAHLVIYADTAACVDESTFSGVVDKWIDENPYAAERGHRTDTGTVSIESGDIPRATESGYPDNSQCAIYTATQIPHLPELGSAKFHQYLHGAVCHSTETSGYSSSRGWPANVDEGNNSDGYNENQNIPFDINVTV